MAIIIYGPQGCGKTRHAAALAKHFNLASVIEADQEWFDQPISRQLSNLSSAARLRSLDALILTNEDLTISRSFSPLVLPFNEAIKLIKA